MKTLLRKLSSLFTRTRRAVELVASEPLPQIVLETLDLPPIEPLKNAITNIDEPTTHQLECESITHELDIHQSKRESRVEESGAVTSNHVHKAGYESVGTDQTMPRPISPSKPSSTGALLQVGGEETYVTTGQFEHGILTCVGWDNEHLHHSPIT